MVIEVPEHIEASLSPNRAALNFAVGLYSAEEVTLEQGANIAKISQPEFLKELATRKIPVHYGIDEFDEDLATIARLKTK
jgi:predicted HTH domain antitoxin